MTTNMFAGSPWDPIVAFDYAQDAWQRSLLYLDVMRRRGNQYRSSIAEVAPSVLNFRATAVMCGRELPRPVNYNLVRIVTRADASASRNKRPIIVVDPRAGHGPGIGGFKPDSEVGAALKAGHPCYFIEFARAPIPGQTVEDVMRAEAAFVKEVARRHPDSRGKPAVIGNCQAGWQVLMAAAVWPKLFGPIIVAGAPVSYWAGRNPMRYLGGLLGGSWLTALASDLGNGSFDGASLVESFEDLDPANTLWRKQYDVYSKVDTEGPRYLGFEKYWGNHVLLTDAEIQYIVDNLFVGNKLSAAQLATSDGIPIDLRNIRSPIVVLSSYGDNITPPGQALGWVTDLYRDDDDVLAHDQTIVFATHDSIGHLGIFVAGSVGRREHRELIANIDSIDLFPPGIYRAEVRDKPIGVSKRDLVDGRYLLTVRRSSMDEVRGIVRPEPASERKFATAARISELNLTLYRKLWQPWVRGFASDTGAQWWRDLQPIRIGFECWSDLHPLAPWVGVAAAAVRKHRVPVPPDNPFLALQTQFSDAIVAAFNDYRDLRDGLRAWWFSALYGAPWTRLLAGEALDAYGSVRSCASVSTCGELDARENDLSLASVRIKRAGWLAAVVRGLYYLVGARGRVDDRDFRYVVHNLLAHSRLPALDEASLRRFARRQMLLVQRMPDAAIAAIPALLSSTPAGEISRGIHVIEGFAARRGGPSRDAVRRTRRVVRMFQEARPRMRTGQGLQRRK